MSINTLATDVEIEGSVHFSGEMTLDCKVLGEITSEKGILVLEKNSEVLGNIKTDDITIHGKVEGEIEVADCKLKGSADVKGDLAYKSLSMESGVKMVGTTKVLS